MTVQDVARRLKCSRALVYGLCEKVKLNYHRLGLGRATIRISESDLKAFLQAAHVKRQGREVVRASMTVAALRAAIAERGLENTLDNRAVIAAWIVDQWGE